MPEIFISVLSETAPMLPLLLVVYVGIEIAEYKFGHKTISLVQKAGSFGPAVGAIAGIFPQCGLAVVATSLYTQRLITIGALLAVYLATSDEAIPIILSHPDKFDVLLPLILGKILIALLAGYSLDFMFRKNNRNILAHIHDYAHGKDDSRHHHEEIMDREACCGHNPCSPSQKLRLRQIIFHPVIHTAKIFIFIFVISFLMESLFLYLGEEAVEKTLMQHTLLQPFFAALFGLAPSCAASVVITEMYIKGSLTYGSLIAGLCASSGLGILVLFKEVKSKKEIFKIIGLLLGISILAGYLFQEFFCRL
jgi:hypothetical protein